jgi:hypothetical protein
MCFSMSSGGIRNLEKRRYEKNKCWSQIELHDLLNPFWSSAACKPFCIRSNSKAQTRRRRPIPPSGINNICRGPVAVWALHPGQLCIWTMLMYFISESDFLEEFFYDCLKVALLWTSPRAPPDTAGVAPSLSSAQSRVCVKCKLHTKSQATATRKSHKHNKFQTQL